MAGRMPMSRRRRILIDAARTVCERDGVHAATTRDIAAEADMPLASVHYAFTSREQLIASVVLGCVEAHRPDYLGDLSGAADPAELIGTVLELLSEHTITHPQRELCRLELVNYALRCGPDALIAGRQHQAMLHTMTEILRIAEDKGYRWDVPIAQVAWQLTAFHDAVSQSFLVTRDADAVRRLVRITAPMLAAQASKLTD